MHGKGNNIIRAFCTVLQLVSAYGTFKAHRFVCSCGKGNYLVCTVHGTGTSNHVELGTKFDNLVREMILYTPSVGYHRVNRKFTGYIVTRKGITGRQKCQCRTG